ncbi:MAG: hypothetical protein QOF69_4121 [Solirubrobacteraceae bacterium]|nr:hypothetical protein [Solirubrobacteraceae bacterium]
MDAALRVRSLPMALVALTVVLALAGGLFATSILRTGSASTSNALPKGPWGTSQDIPVSFGALAVEHASKVKGLTAKDLAGAVHGIGSLVPAGQTQVNVDVNMTNLLPDPIAYDPEQFTLHIGSPTGKAVLVTKSSLRVGKLQPSASIDGELAFVIPASKKKLWLSFKDPGQSRPVVVDLGNNAQAKKTPQSAFDHFFHHTH